MTPPPPPTSHATPDIYTHLANSVEEGQGVGPRPSRIHGETVSRLPPCRFFHRRPKLYTIKTIVSDDVFPKVVPVVPPERKILRCKRRKLIAYFVFTCTGTYRLRKLSRTRPGTVRIRASRIAAIPFLPSSAPRSPHSATRTINGGCRPSSFLYNHSWVNSCSPAPASVNRHHLPRQASTKGRNPNARCYV